MPWDQNKNVIGISGYDSNWATSSLNKILNVDYYNGNVSGTITSYSGTSGSTSTSIDMNSKGLKNNETRSLISSYNWNVGGHSEYSIYSNQAYTYERGNTVYTGNSTIVTDKIAIPYASDYGYAADPTKCAGLSIYNYNRSTTSYQCRKMIGCLIVQQLIGHYFQQPLQTERSILILVAVLIIQLHIHPMQ